MVLVDRWDRSNGFNAPSRCQFADRFLLSNLFSTSLSLSAIFYVFLFCSSGHSKDRETESDELTGWSAKANRWIHRWMTGPAPTIPTAFLCLCVCVYALYVLASFLFSDHVYTHTLLPYKESLRLKSPTCKLSRLD